MKTIKDMLSRLAMMCRLEVAIVSELEKQDSRIKALEENRKIKDQTILEQQKRIQQLELILRQNNPMMTPTAPVMGHVK